MKHSIDKGLLRSAEIGDFELSDFGIEFSDHVSFCTLTEIPRHAHIEMTNCSNTDTASSAKYRIHLAEGIYELAVETIAEPKMGKISINAILNPLRDSTIQDFVIRMKVNKKNVALAHIAGRTYEHSNSEIYRQFTTSHAKLTSHSNHALDIRRTAQSSEDAEWQMYVRDLPGFWIIHSRLFPKTDCNTLWLRWINRFFWMSFSTALSNRIGRIKKLREFLWYRKERYGKRWIHMQLIGMIPVKRNNEIYQSIEITFK